MKNPSRSIGRLGAAVAALACLTLAGCVKNNVDIQVDKDGSGRILVTRLYPRVAAEQMEAQWRTMAIQNPMMVSTNRDPFFDLKAIRRAAAQFGPSVKFAKARKIDTMGARGYVALYTFKNINEVSVNVKALNQDLSQGIYSHNYGMPDDDEEDGEEGASIAYSSSRGEAGENFEFKLTPGATNRLQVMCPASSDELNQRMEMMGGMEGDEAEANEEAMDEREEQMAAYQGYETMMGASYGNSMRYFAGANDQDEAMAGVFKGARVSVAVEVNGTPVKSSASLADPARKNRFYLLDFDADKVNATEDGKAMMKKNRYRYGDPTMMMAAAVKAGLPIMETNREVVVEFK